MKQFALGRWQKRINRKPKQPKLFAILHDGTTEGDNQFSFPSKPLRYKKGMSVDDLVKSYLANEEDKEYANEMMEEVAGAVIVTPQTIKKMEMIWDVFDPGCDSAVYKCNNACKRLALQEAVKHLGKKMEEL